MSPYRVRIEKPREIAPAVSNLLVEHLAVLAFLWLSSVARLALAFAHAEGLRFEPVAAAALVALLPVLSARAFRTLDRQG